ncbi:hypothetical protein ASG87_14970 [Frateuria sp. Soil773]|uniref:hypothetical protein n=1 Tax=Frateuria sp. Soil773 TaxID=1736407 RepID=UPI0006FF3553|nr:hypothetical protein [Frateuria sp. Soil773]KRE97824.1 hypothetical protein ASG87_14970 [Frateuria sp. Soil773]
MSDTIELLEAIGRDASLRYASAEELAGVLAQAQASEALASAVAQGDSALLAVELGQRSLDPPQISQFPGHEDDEPEQDEDEDEEHGEPPAHGRSEPSPR